MAAPEDDEEWKYSVDEVGEDAEDGTAPGDGNGGEDGGGVDRRIEPGSIDPENVLFVVLGVLIAVGTIAYGLGII